MASRPIRNYEDLYLFLSILKEKHSLYGDFAAFGRFFRFWFGMVRDRF